MALRADLQIIARGFQQLFASFALACARARFLDQRLQRPQPVRTGLANRGSCYTSFSWFSSIPK